MRLLGLLEDHREALGKAFSLKDFDKDAWEMREARRKEHESGKKRRGSLSSIKDDPNEMNPRRSATRRPGTAFTPSTRLVSIF